ncbi:MAG: hypothetical protein K0R38_3817 [Polyangiaceae bacterium]|jgi:hypothetical protein|nr:hypothetical protein [Polyangiaceae bacterium]
MNQFAHASVRPPILSQATSKLSKLIMTCYRWVGFSVLIAVLLGLVSYIGLNVLYLFNRGWLAPAIVSPTDARVLDLSSRAAQERWLREKLEGERAELEARAKRAHRVIGVEKNYQAALRDSVAADAQNRQAGLSQLYALNQQYRRAKQEIEAPSEAFAAVSKERSEQQLSAQLIDQDTMTARSRELAQIAQSKLSLRERQVELGARVSTMSQELAALQSLSANFGLGPGQKPLTYSALGVVHEYSQSVLTMNSAEDDVTSSERGIAALDRAAEHYDNLLKTLENAPLVRAASEKLTLAFVPYENLHNVSPGATLYGCKYQVIWCARAGKVRAVLEGEVVAKHALYGTDLRGQFVEIDVEDGQAMKLPVLHANRPPLFF